MYYIYVDGEAVEEFLSNSIFMEFYEFILRDDVAPKYPYLFSLVASGTIMFASTECPVIYDECEELLSDTELTGGENRWVRPLIRKIRDYAHWVANSGEAAYMEIQQ